MRLLRRPALAIDASLAATLAEWAIIAWVLHVATNPVKAATTTSSAMFLWPPGGPLGVGYVKQAVPVPSRVWYRAGACITLFFYEHPCRAVGLQAS